jgi:hypothetical protein
MCDALRTPWTHNEVPMAEKDTPAKPWRELKRDERLAWAVKIASHVEVDRENRIICTAAICPNCGHGFSATVTDADILFDVERGMRDNPSVDWSGSLKFTIACGCDEGHPGRPPELSHGCGASGPFKDVP